VKDDAAPSQSAASDSTATTPIANRKVAPLPRGFERKTPPGIENVNVNRAVLVDAGSDAAVSN